VAEILALFRGVYGEGRFYEFCLIIPGIWNSTRTVCGKLTSIINQHRTWNWRAARVIYALLDLFSKPEFPWRPSQLMRSRTLKPSDTHQNLPLPWDCTIAARSTEVVGRLIATLGLYDLPLTEAIIRLATTGDTGLDVGGQHRFYGIGA